jgi:hypothetical protein
MTVGRCVVPAGHPAIPVFTRQHQRVRPQPGILPAFNPGKPRLAQQREVGRSVLEVQSVTGFVLAETHRPFLRPSHGTMP